MWPGAGGLLGLPWKVTAVLLGTCLYQALQITHAANAQHPVRDLYLQPGCPQGLRRHLFSGSVGLRGLGEPSGKGWVGGYWNEGQEALVDLKLWSSPARPQGSAQA